MCSSFGPPNNKVRGDRTMLRSQRMRNPKKIKLRSARDRSVLRRKTLPAIRRLSRSVLACGLQGDKIYGARPS
jgi:hypothetical protein